MTEKILKKSFSSETLGAIIIIFFGALFILANINFGFNWPLFGIFSLVAILVSWRFPQSGILASVFLTIVFERFFTLQTFWIDKIEYKLYPLDIVMLGVFLGILFNFILSSKKVQTFKKTDWFLVGFIVWNILYFLGGFFLGNFEKSLALSSLKNYAFYPLLYFASAWVFVQKKDRARIVNFFLVACGIDIFFIIYGILHGQGLWSEYTPLSTSGTRILAFTHALFLSLGFLILSVRLALQKTRENLGTLLLMAFFALGILGSLMRHLWISLLLSLLAIFFFLLPEQRKRLFRQLSKIGFVFLLAVLISFYLANLFPQSELHNFWSGALGSIGERGASLASASADESFSWREMVWKGAFSEFKNSPVWGIGTGKKIYVENETYKDYIEIKNIHNSYLAIFFQLGIIGFFFFLMFIFRKIKELAGKAFRPFDFQRLSFLAVIVFFLFSFPFQPYLETNLLSLLFWIFMGVSRNLDEKN